MGEVVRIWDAAVIRQSQPVMTQSEVDPMTEAQLAYLRRGLSQPGGKLPLFDLDGQQISLQTVKSCIRAGWAEPWFENPIKPDWVVCKLTPAGRAYLESKGN